MGLFVMIGQTNIEEEISIYIISKYVDARYLKVYYTRLSGRFAPSFILIVKCSLCIHSKTKKRIL